MMFHVKLIVLSAVNKGITLFLLFVFLGCGIARVTPQIPDYLLVPNGKELIGTQPLNAFVFENNPTKIPIEQFLSDKFKTDNYSQKEYWVTVDKDKYKIIVYDYSEFEKYFGSANYAVMNEYPDNAKKGDLRKFIAISVINSYNEDCLSDRSLFQNTTVKYLKKLKDEYYNQ